MITSIRENPRHLSEHLIITALFMGFCAICSSQRAHPLLPPYGCANYGACAPASAIKVTGNTSTDYYYCSSASYCRCNDGTSGTNCTTAQNLCASNPCPTDGNYTCKRLINNYDCVCTAGFTGDHCELDISDPCASSPCLNGGNCKSQNQTIQCECGDKWLGEICQYENTCYLKKAGCVNGKCRMLWSGEAFRCDCDDGWQGAKCDQREKFANDTDPTCNKAPQEVRDNIPERMDMGSKPSKTRCEDYYKEKQNSVDPPYDTYAVYGSVCFLSVGNPFNQSSNDCDQECWKFGGFLPNYDGAKEKCGYPKKEAILVTTMSYWYETKQCETMECNYGECIEENENAKCVCMRGHTGPDCNKTVTPCQSNPCGEGNNCTNHMETNTYSCTCQTSNYTGQHCDELIYCGSSPCLYGGKCIELDDGYECECLSFYTGNNCELPDYCVSNPCLHGQCTPVNRALRSTFKCSCDPGWNGTSCSVDIDECGSSPCMYGGTCSQIVPPADPWFKCACVSGTQGQYCEHNPDDCEYRHIDGQLHSTCNISDPEAKCIDGLNAYTCSCGPDFTGQFCEIEMLIYDVLIKIFGGVDDEMLDMLQQLLGNPSMIKDMVPFILGLKSDEERTEMSWNYEDLFDWATYEEKTLDIEKDLIKWNDVSLGNCFTFNHRNNTRRKYLKRMPGVYGGFYAKMRIQQDEYFPWVDTEAILVFVHPEEEDIFSESVRYNAEPQGQTELYPKLTEYSRLGGKYGRCVNDPDEVDAYYYSGDYATDGCLRSCYQNAVYKECGCMDPRYPKPAHVPICDLTTRNCVEGVVVNKGDPSTWADCVCPLPCNNRQYFVRWSRGKYASEFTECQMIADNDLKANCTREASDTVLIQVSFTGMDYQYFQETPAMDFNKFISNLGGLLGVLMGVCIISFIELALLLFTCWRILMTNKK